MSLLQIRRPNSTKGKVGVKGLIRVTKRISHDEYLHIVVNVARVVPLPYLQLQRINRPYILT